MTFNTTDEASGVSIVSNSQITIANPGTYNLQFSAQLDQSSGGTENIYIWLRKNGIDVPQSSSHVAIQGTSAENIAAWNFIVTTTVPNDYYELMWYASSSNVQISAVPAASLPTGPAIPSVILTVQQVMYTQGGYSIKYTSAGTYTPTLPLGNYKISIEYSGAGGGGGGTTVYPGPAQVPPGGGGGGSGVIKTYSMTANITSNFINFSIGSGGTAGSGAITPASPSAGGTGGSTNVYFASPYGTTTLTAAGGGGGDEGIVSSNGGNGGTGDFGGSGGSADSGASATAGTGGVGNISDGANGTVALGPNSTGGAGGGSSFLIKGYGGAGGDYYTNGGNGNAGADGYVILTLTPI